MKILAYVHGYPPTLNGGAEIMLHQVLLELKSRGHDVAVITDNPGAVEYEEILLFPVDENSSKEIELFNWCDLVFTHLDHSLRVIHLGKKYKKQVVHLVHNDWVEILHKDYHLHENHKIDPEVAALAIANSNWVKNTINPDIESIVVNPPTKLEKYRTETTKEFVTLINLHGTKGGDLFWELAQKMPNVQFMGVKGGWGDSILKSGFSNVTILENTTDIKSVYAKTRILIMPSTYESWGRVAVEAACSGIPVIATPMPGPKESLGSAAIFADTQNFSEWCEAIQRLNDESIYSEYSIAVQRRAQELSEVFDGQMNVLEEKLLDLVSTT
jgi:glycosyltransferase involved in cell wall biosynthesis